MPWPSMKAIMSSLIIVKSSGVCDIVSDTTLYAVYPRTCHRWPLFPTPFRTLCPAIIGIFANDDRRRTRLILRYTRPEMGRIWSDENRFRTWLAVEVAATETLAEAGMVPKEAARAIRERADFSVERIHEIEAEGRHDVIAFTTAVAEVVSPGARWFHYGLTSNELGHTAHALV